MKIYFHLLSGDPIPGCFEEASNIGKARQQVASALNVRAERLRFVRSDGCAMSDEECFSDIASATEEAVVVQVCVLPDPREKVLADIVGLASFEELVEKEDVALNIPKNVGIFHDLPERVGDLKLKELRACSLQLTALPASFHNIRTLRTLMLKGNLLSGLPDRFSSLCSLQVLSLAGNQISELPVDIGLLADLRSLDLCENKILSLPDSFGQLGALEELVMYSNQLTALPDSFCELVRLSELDLSDNKLEALPTDFGKLTQLTGLRLEGNSLQELPESCGNLKLMEEFAVDARKLRAWPASCEHLKDLHYQIELMGGI